jgi:hypothetical protein
MARFETLEEEIVSALERSSIAAFGSYLGPRSRCSPRHRHFLDMIIFITQRVLTQYALE